jgi:hypothetical protein
MLFSILLPFYDMTEAESSLLNAVILKHFGNGQKTKE